MGVARSIQAIGMAVLVATAFAAVGCGSSKNSGGSSSGGSSTTASTDRVVKAAAAETQKWTKFPDKINVTVPLKKAPPTGLDVAFLEGNGGGIDALVPGIKTGAKDLGWNVKITSYDIANPTALNSAMQQAVAQKPDYIIEVASSSAQFKQGLAAARKAKIPVVEVSTVPEKTPGIVGCISCRFNKLAAKVVANWILADSKGKAHVLVVNTPSFPIAVSETDAVKETMAPCSGCKVTVLNEPLTVLGTNKAAQAAAAAARAHPDINYVFTAYGQLNTGMVAAFKAAGLNNVKLTDQYSTPEDLANIKSGALKASFSGAVPEWGWRAIDLIARHSLGMSTAPSEDPQPAAVLFTKDNPPKSTTEIYQGIPDMGAQYEALWHVGG